MTPVPVTVLTGFLGAGKTSLLNNLLRATHGRRFAVIVNEFGEAGIDGELLASGADEVIEMANGCVCCSVRGDLLRTLHTLLPKIGDYDGVVIETSGLADPGPVAQTLLMDDVLREKLCLDGIVTVVDALHILDQLGAQAEAAEQVAFADLIVLSKTDLVTPAAVAAVTSRLRSANPGATVVTADRGVLPVETLLNRGAFNLARIEDLLTVAEARGPLHDHHGDHDHDHHDHHHDDHDHSHGPAEIMTVTLRADRPLDAGLLLDWLTGHLASHGADVLRLKGILSITGENRRLVLQGVHTLLEGDYLSDWPDGPRPSRLVLIGRNLDAQGLQHSFDACLV
ncbi:GTP-binding protein [Tabrizicola sp. WMC-M-20]|nr:GTP-binding protein [Tabrizicola sp. WMC-M-20]